MLHDRFYIPPKFSFGVSEPLQNAECPKFCFLLEIRIRRMSSVIFLRALYQPNENKMKKWKQHWTNTPTLHRECCYQAFSQGKYYYLLPRKRVIKLEILVGQDPKFPWKFSQKQVFLHQKNLKNRHSSPAVNKKKKWKLKSGRLKSSFWNVKSQKKIVCWRIF